jgi:RND family efflux transporter MFP subunit
VKLSPKLLVPVAVLALGALAAALVIATGPRIEAEPAAVVAPLVRVAEVRLVDLPLEVVTHGTVAPRTESALVPEVAGRVIEVSPSLVSGGFFREGELLLRIEPRDYEVALERARAAQARAKSEHERAQRELGRRQRLAAQDMASAAQLDIASNAAAAAAAALRETSAAREQAERDLARTALRAPFDGRVRDERVDVGQFVNRGVALGTLYAVDFAEVRLPIPDEELAYLELPLVWGGGIPAGEGPEVRLVARFGGREHEWIGRVVRTEGEIDPRSRMVHVIARVEDPYGRRDGGERPPLAVGLFVKAHIRGRLARGVAVLPRAALRGERQVLVVDAEGRLRFRDVELLRSQRDEVVIRAGLAEGEQVSLSTLDTVVDGMQVRVAPAASVAAGGPGR